MPFDWQVVKAGLLKTDNLNKILRLIISKNVQDKTENHLPHQGQKNVVFSGKQSLTDNTKMTQKWGLSGKDVKAPIITNT